MTQHSSPPPRDYDGVICFGGVDWWYHNRGHYDIQLMRHLAEQVPVLYVNSLGMRAPSAAEGRMFVRRVTRKLASIGRGLRRVENQLWVTSLLTSPGLRRSPFQSRLVTAWLCRAARRAGIQRPLLWIACPAALPLAEGMQRVGMVMQRTDRFEAFQGVAEDELGRWIASARAGADLTLYCNRELLAQERSSTRQPAFVDHGVDYEHFARARRSRWEPVDMQSLPRPRVGFIGGIDAHTFDPELFRAVTRALPDLHFPLIGGATLPAGDLMGPNVTMLGRKPLEQVPHYMNACDVLIMPWRQNEWIRGCNPVKLKEYLAAGKPIVSTPFPELEAYRDLVHIAPNADAFVEAIRGSVQRLHDPQPGTERVREESWRSKLSSVLHILSAQGLRLEMAG